MSARVLQPHKRSLIEIVTLWVCTFGGGVVTGIGLAILGEVQILRYLHDELQRVGFMGRLLGKLTFSWRDLDEKIALAMGEIPPEYIDKSETTAYWLMGIGFVGVNLVLSFVVRTRLR